MNKTAHNVLKQGFRESKGLYVEQMRNGMRIIFEGAYFITAAKTIMDENNPVGHGPIIARMVDNGAIGFIEKHEVPTTDTERLYLAKYAAATAAVRAVYLFLKPEYIFRGIPIPEFNMKTLNTIVANAEAIESEAIDARGHDGNIKFITGTVHSVFMYFFHLPIIVPPDSEFEIPFGIKPDQRNLKYAAINTSNLGIHSSPDRVYEIIHEMKKSLGI